MMIIAPRHLLSRRKFCLCCITATGGAATGGWLTPIEALAEARGIIKLIKSEAATAPIYVDRFRGNVAVLEGSGGNIAVLTGRDGKLLLDAGISVSRPQIATALAGLGTDPITHLTRLSSFRDTVSRSATGP